VLLMCLLPVLVHLLLLLGLVCWLLVLLMMRGLCLGRLRSLILVLLLLGLVSWLLVLLLEVQLVVLYSSCWLLLLLLWDQRLQHCNHTLAGSKAAMHRHLQRCRLWYCLPPPHLCLLA
jgi:hypothetical protein